MQYTGETIDSAISKGLQDLSVDRENVLKSSLMAAKDSWG